MADFARRVVTRAEPKSPARAKALLFAAGKLGTFATSVGLELDPESVLSPSLIERFIVTEGALLGPATRRTLRSNLRFLSAASITNAPPAPVPLSRSGPRPLQRGADRGLPGPGRRPADARPAGCGSLGWSRSGPGPG